MCVCSFHMSRDAHHKGESTNETIISRYDCLFTPIFLASSGSLFAPITSSFIQLVSWALRQSSDWYSTKSREAEKPEREGEGKSKCSLLKVNYYLNKMCTTARAQRILAEPAAESWCKLKSFAPKLPALGKRDSRNHTRRKNICLALPNDVKEKALRFI